MIAGDDVSADMQKDVAKIIEQKNTYLNHMKILKKFYGKKADKKRKLYNGMLKCNIYQYFKNNSKG